MVDRAEVVGLERQLTVPSRHRGHLVDVWVAVEWQPGYESWVPEFQSLCAAPAAVPDSLGAIEVVPMSAQRGWVVARGVNRKVIALEQVESEVRTIVGQVNARVAEAPMMQSAAESEARKEKAREYLSRVGTALLGAWDRSRASITPVPTARSERAPSPLPRQFPGSKISNSGNEFISSHPVA
jgi:hypothetical protein